MRMGVRVWGEGEISTGEGRRGRRKMLKKKRNGKGRIKETKRRRNRRKKCIPNKSNGTSNGRI